MNHGSGTSSANFIVLPESKQLIIDSNIALFELKKRTQAWQGSRDFGYWDVRVIEDIDHNNMINYRKVWAKGPTASIEFTPNNKGIALAFCPDDEFWYNRVKLAATIDHGEYNIERRHTRNGYINGPVATKEITILRDYLYDYCLMFNGQVIFRTKNRTEAEEVQYTKMSENAGSSITVMRRLIAPLDKLLAKHKGGWVQSPEFQEEHKSAVQAIISKEIGSSNKPSMVEVGDQLLGAVSRMTEEQRAQLAKLLKVESTERYVKSTGIDKAKSLDETNDINTLRRLAKQKGISTSGMSKDDIKTALKEINKEEHDEAQTPLENDRYEGMNLDDTDDDENTETIN